MYGIDIETFDPYLTDKGPSWVYGEGSIIVVGLYDALTGDADALEGNGGERVLSLLQDKDALLIGANIAYDIGWLCYSHNITVKEVRCGLVDIGIAEQALDEYQPYSLDALAWKYLGKRKGSEELKAIAESKGYKGDFRKHLKKLWDDGYKNEIKKYAISDADQPVRIWKEQLRYLKGEAVVLYTGPSGNTCREKFAESLDAVLMNFRLIKITLGMKQRGIKVDMKKREKNHAFLAGIQQKLSQDFTAKYGQVNFNSSKQLAELFDREHIPYKYRITIKGLKRGAKPGEKIIKGRELCRSFTGSEAWEQQGILKNTFNGVRVQKGKLVLYVPKQYASRTNDDIRNMGYVTTCNPSIDKKVLLVLKKKYDAARAIVDLKQVTSIIDKFLGPNFDRFIVQHGKDDYRIHADFNIVGARRTGRFSSANPNLQQVPSKTVLFEKASNEVKLYELCRETLIPDDNMLMGKVDYAGQENRIMAHFAVGQGADEIRKKYGQNPDLDFHSYIGEISGLYEDYGPDVGRKYAKNCSFGLGYGMRLTTMCETFGWSKEGAERITALYHDGAPFVKATMDKVSEVIINRGYVKTLAGRHSHLLKFKGKPDVRSAYTGFNKLIQGSAADMMKKVLVMLDERGLLEDFPLYLTIHDEIDFGIPMSAAALRRLPEIQEVMEHTFALSVPMRIDLEIGHDWGHVKGRRKRENKKTKEVRVETMRHFVERTIKECGGMNAVKRESRAMTLYENCGFCPLQLWLEYHQNKDCFNCPMQDGVDIGVGWLSHCGNECRVIAEAELLF